MVDLADLRSLEVCHYRLRHRFPVVLCEGICERQRSGVSIDTDLPEGGFSDLLVTELSAGKHKA